MPPETNNAMLKFIKHHLDTIGGIEIYPLISFIIFFLFFTGLLLYVARLKKETINEISNIPLDPNDTDYEKE
jgi:cytochrome c oxidase cbb3-type subunit IV